MGDGQESAASGSDHPAPDQVSEVNGVHPPATSQRQIPVALLVTIPSIGLLAVVIYAFQFSLATFVTVVGVGALTAVAAMFAGGLLGLLFGIPRSARLDGQAAEPGRSPSGAAYVANTNLEQISDWLTKILVGVGLVQLGAIANGTVKLTQFLATGLGDQASSQVLALGLLIFFSVWGFLVGYMFARTYLPGMFRVADEDALRVVSEVRAELVAVQQRADKQEDYDVRALSMCSRVLSSGGTGGQAVKPEELGEAFKNASRSVLIQIFNQAQETRTRTWRTDKAAMERTIPIFRALIACDERHQFHRNYGQLGYALKDQRQPDYSGAMAALEEAIRIRDQTGDRGWVLYEMVRATCLIALDPDFAQERPSTPQLRTAVLSDMRAAVAVRWVRAMYGKDDPYRKWIELNGVTSSELGNP